MSKANIQHAPYDFRRKGYIDGMQYAIVQHMEMGHLCGYIRLPRSHPLYAIVTAKRWNKRAFKKYTRYPQGYDHRAVYSLDVHGGITFAGRRPFARGIWIGFDCAHLDDHVPGYPGIFPGTFKDANYVHAQLRHLASQLSEVTQ